MTAAPAPIPGAEALDGATRFTVYATTAEHCSVRLFSETGVALRTERLAALGQGYFSSVLGGVGHGASYQFVLDGRELPDPYARYLPNGVHGPAMVWQAQHGWRHGPGVARPLREHVIYELHVGTFTPGGTYASAAERLPDLAKLGVTAVELMPLSAFAGSRGWGYDGVAHYAPFAGYGTPDDLRRFVDATHGLGLAVLVDVVYNHFGPSGNYLAAYSPHYFSTTLRNAWGDAPDYTRPVMRDYAIRNARYWLEEFRFDGLRLDAIHAIVDPSPRHVLAEIADMARQLEPRKLLIAEDERNDPSDVLELGVDAIWADDFHHQTRVTLTGEHDGYYCAYHPGTADLARAIDSGWLYTGQHYPATDKARGKPAGELTAEQFVYCIQNHDQIGNRAFGNRLTSDVTLPEYAAVSMLLLVLPMTPLLFMGQEWAASTPFIYFTDHDAELGRLVAEGRRAEFARFEAFADPESRARIPDPQAPASFERSRLDWSELAKIEHARVLDLYQALLQLRRDDPVLRAVGRDGLRAQSRGSVLAVELEHERRRRLLLVNFGSDAVPEAGLPSLEGLCCVLQSDLGAWSGTLPGQRGALFSSE